MMALVAGPPCSGKNRYVDEHRRPGDLVIDFDALITALGGSGSHDQPEQLKRYAFEARDAVMAAYELRRDVDVWVILGAPRRRDRDKFLRRGYRVVVLDTDMDTCLARARAERPPEWQDYVRNWFSRFEPDLLVPVSPPGRW